MTHYRPGISERFTIMAARRHEGGRMQLSLKNTGSVGRHYVSNLWLTRRSRTYDVCDMLSKLGVKRKYSYMSNMSYIDQNPCKYINTDPNPCKHHNIHVDIQAQTQAEANNFETMSSRRSLISHVFRYPVVSFRNLVMSFVHFCQPVMSFDIWSCLSLTGHVF